MLVNWLQLVSSLVQSLSFTKSTNFIQVGPFSNHILRDTNTILKIIKKVNYFYHLFSSEEEDNFSLTTLARSKTAVKFAKTTNVR